MKLEPLMESYFSSSNLNAHSVGLCMAEEEKESASSNFLLDKLEELRLHQQSRNAQIPAEQIQRLPQEVKQLPQWSDAVKCVPNVVLNSSLFTGSKNPKMFKTLELLATMDGIEIRFKGHTFNQTHLSVWLMLLHQARLQPLGDIVEFTVNSFLKDLGRHGGKEQYKQLKEEIERLKSSSIEIKFIKEKRIYRGRLVDDGHYDEKKKRYVFRLNPNILILYESKGGYTFIDWEQRQALKGYLVKWLHGFYSSHAAPYDLKVRTVKRLCGSAAKDTADDLNSFRQRLKKDLEKLVDVGAINSWKISWNDLVCVDNKPSLSQQRSLKKKMAQGSRNTSIFSQIGNFAR